MADTELAEEAKALFNCDKRSILNYLVETNTIIGASDSTKKKLHKYQIKSKSRAVGA